MYHGNTNERQHYQPGHWLPLLTVTSDSAAKGLAKDLEVAGAGQVHSHFFVSPFRFLPSVVPNVVFHSCHHGT